MDGSLVTFVRETRSLFEPVYSRFSERLARSASVLKTRGMTCSRTPHSLNRLPYSTNRRRKSSEEIVSEEDAALVAAAAAALRF